MRPASTGGISLSFLNEMDVETGFIDSAIRDKGCELQSAYQNASPFPHIAIEDFLPPHILDLCLAEFPSPKAEVQFDRDQERLKSQFNPDELSPKLRALFYSFNSRPFIRLIENISGIKGLIPDPYFLGGGFHEISNGGHLSVHTDFNHHRVMNLERRINVLIYLNKNWRDDYGGQLELWNSDMSRSVQSFTPELNRCVIFNTTNSSFHGNPSVVNNPNNVSRKSIALYYYTSTWSADKREHTTQFRIRKGSADKRDAAVTNRELLTDLLPPIVLRNAKRLLGGARD
jgi:hypothetical protein